MSLSLCLLCILLVPLATAGLALMQQGLGRSRSAETTPATVTLSPDLALSKITTGSRSSPMATRRPLK